MMSPLSYIPKYQLRKNIVKKLLKLNNAAMDRWHDLKLPRGAYLHFMPETLFDGLACNRLVQI